MIEPTNKFLLSKAQEFFTGTIYPDQIDMIREGWGNAESLTEEQIQDRLLAKVNAFNRPGDFSAFGWLLYCDVILCEAILELE